jgi:DNA polymerase III alpha subunit
MAKFQLEDLTGTITAVAFADTWEEVRHKVEEDMVVFVLGQVKQDEEKRELRVAEIFTEEEMLAERVDSLTLALDDEFFDHPEKPARLREILVRHRGRRKIFFRIIEQDQVTTVSSDQDRRIAIGEELITELSGLLPAPAIGFNLLPPPRARRRSYKRRRRQGG